MGEFRKAKHPGPLPWQKAMAFAHLKKRASRPSIRPLVACDFLRVLRFHGLAAAPDPMLSETQTARRPATVEASDSQRPTAFGAPGSGPASSDLGESL